MATNNGSADYNKKVDELIAIIAAKKLFLIGKYGTHVKKYWERRG